MAKHTHWVAVFLLVVGAANAQPCQKEFPEGMADARFQDNGDGTVTDLKTGLIWKQCAEGLSGDDCTEGELHLFTYPLALRRAAETEFAGSTLWRLPSKEELATLVDKGCRDPAIDTRYFPNTPAGWFYSSTTGAGYPYYAWSVNFSDGQVGNEDTGASYLRLMRYRD